MLGAPTAPPGRATVWPAWLVIGGSKGPEPSGLGTRRPASGGRPGRRGGWAPGALGTTRGWPKLGWRTPPAMTSVPDGLIVTEATVSLPVKSSEPGPETVNDLPAPVMSPVMVSALGAATEASVLLSSTTGTAIV